MRRLPREGKQCERIGFPASVTSQRASHRPPTEARPAKPPHPEAQGTGHSVSTYLPSSEPPCPAAGTPWPGRWQGVGGLPGEGLALRAISCPEPVGRCGERFSGDRGSEDREGGGPCSYKGLCPWVGPRESAGCHPRLRQQGHRQFSAEATEGHRVQEGQWGLELNMVDMGG